MYGDWRDLHLRVMSDFLLEMNNNIYGFVLKGGTSLLFCYGLNRFSVDIDLDVIDRTLTLYSFVDSFCKKHNVSYRIAKDTETVKRYMIHYGGNKPLKVEVSYRQLALQSDIDRINGVLVYTIKKLFSLKLIAYNGRTKIRDLFDVMFIYKHYHAYLTDYQISMLRDIVSYKGLDDAEVLVREQSDEFIDSNQLIIDYLDTYNSLGLL